MIYTKRKDMEDSRIITEEEEEGVTEIGLEDLKDFYSEEYDLVMLRASAITCSKQVLINTVVQIMHEKEREALDKVNHSHIDLDDEIDYDLSREDLSISFLLLKK